MTAFNYPAAAGDPPAPLGITLVLLTQRGTPMIGPWVADGFFIAWALLPERSPPKEERLS